jgi:hypothetical protein
MKTILTLFFALSLLTVAKAQTNANVIVTDCSGPAMCDGAATVIGTSLNTTYNDFYWFHNGIYLNTGNSIFNLCPGTYMLQASGNGLSMNFNFTVGPPSNDPCLGFQISYGSSSASTPQSCDGQADAMVNSYGTAPYTFHWAHYTDSAQWISWTDSPTSNLSSSISACVGEYIVTCTDANGCSDSVQFYVGQNSLNTTCLNTAYNLTVTPASCATCTDGSFVLSPSGGNGPYYYILDSTMTSIMTYLNPWNCNGEFSNLSVGDYLIQIADVYNCVDYIVVNILDATTSPCNNFSTSVNVTDCTLASLCNGAAQVNTTGGNGQLNYAIYQGLSNSAVSNSQTSYTSNLCAGYYTVYVNDAQGCESFTSFYVNGTIDSISVIGTPATGSGIAFSSWIENCDVDLTALDTAYIVSAVYGTTAQTMDSLYAVWYLADTAGLFTNINCAYLVSNNAGIYNLILNVYCPVKSNPIYYQIVSPFDLSTAGLSSSSYVHPFRLFPNPATNLVTIVSPFERNEVEIFNIAGILVYKGISMAKSQDLPLNLPKGTYIICVSTEEQLRYTKKLVIQ